MYASEQKRDTVVCLTNRSWCFALCGGETENFYLGFALLKETNLLHFTLILLFLLTFNLFMCSTFYSKLN